MEKKADMTDFEKKIMAIEVIANENETYQNKLDSYEYLSLEGEEVIDKMIEKLYVLEGDSAQMFVEILANFKGRKEIYMWLVTYFMRGDDIPLFSRLLGAYGEESAIEILQEFAEDNKLDYNEFMEIRNAIEELGGDFDCKQDFSKDPFYRFIKGLDDKEEVLSEDLLEVARKVDEENLSCEDDCDAGCQDDDCVCHGEDDDSEEDFETSKDVDENGYLN